jgi:sec-independent protein translocase protein TatA
MPNVGPMEILLLVGLALLLFGPKKLPEIARSVGKGFREFKGSVSEETSGFRSAFDLTAPAEADVVDGVVDDAVVTSSRDHDRI